MDHLRNRPRLLVQMPPGREEERRYILDLLLTEWLGFDYDLTIRETRRTTIQLASDPHGRALTLPDVLLSTAAGDWLTERSMPVRPLLRVEQPAGLADRRRVPKSTVGGSPPQIPVVYGEPTANSRAWDESPAGLDLAIDVLGSAFWLLTRYEEVVSPERDDHGRFPARASLAMEEGFVGRPLVDEYLDLLWVAMRLLWPNIERKARDFRIRLTHDIDQPWAAWGRPLRVVARAVAGDLLRRRDPILAARRVRALVDARADRIDRDPLNTSGFLMDTSEQHGLRSQFYFMAGTNPADVEFRYRISDRPFAGVLKRIHDRGHDIGLHSGYETYRSEERMAEELAALKDACRTAGFEQPAWGVRQHFLRFAYPDTPRIHEAVGFEHDSTLGFAEEVGFRAGTCREYPLFDAVAGRRLRLRERPLVVMDTTLREYMHLAPTELAGRTRSIVDVCRRLEGDAVLLFHNDGLAGDRSRALYVELIEELVRPL
jgi:hypothetical protein